jgi:hypothetical protein
LHVALVEAIGELGLPHGRRPAGSGQHRGGRSARLSLGLRTSR